MSMRIALVGIGITSALVVIGMTAAIIVTTEGTAYARKATPFEIDQECTRVYHSCLDKCKSNDVPCRNRCVDLAEICEKIEMDDEKALSPSTTTTPPKGTGGRTPVDAGVVKDPVKGTGNPPKGLGELKDGLNKVDAGLMKQPSGPSGGSITIYKTSPTSPGTTSSFPAGSGKGKH
jgi:hypothetical protein